MMSIDKLALGMEGTLGKTVTRVFIIMYPDLRSYLYLVFSDDTYYELYGQDLNGAREVRSGGIAGIRETIRRTHSTVDIKEIGLPGQ